MSQYSPYSNIESVDIVGFLDCSEKNVEFSERLQLYQKGWPRHRFLRRGYQPHDGTTRRVELLIEADTETDYSFHDISLTANLADNLEPTGRLPKSFREILDVIDSIEALDIEAFVHAHVFWRYEKDSFETLINLPTFRTTGGMPFDYVSGMRFVKMIGEEQLAVVLDTKLSGELSVSAQIPIRDHRISLKSIDIVLDRASNLIGDFVTER